MFSIAVSGLLVGLFSLASQALADTSDLNFRRVTSQGKALWLRNCPVVSETNRIRVLRGGNRIALPRNLNRRPIRVQKSRFWACGQNENGQTVLFSKRRAHSPVVEVALRSADFAEKPITSFGRSRGRLSRNTGTSVTVDGRRYFVDEASRFFDYDERGEVSVNFFSVGRCVEIEYYVRGSRRFIEKMEIEDFCGAASGDSGSDWSGNQTPPPVSSPPSSGEREVLGRLSELTAESLVVGGQRFTITNQTRFYDYDQRNQVTRDFFRVGMCVDVEGIGNVATEVEFEDEC